MNIKLVREVIYEAIYNEISKYYNCNKIDIYPYDSHLLININYSEKEPEINVHESVINITDGYWGFPSIVPPNIDGYYSAVKFKLVNDGYCNYTCLSPTKIDKRITQINYLERSGLDRFVLERIKTENQQREETKKLDATCNELLQDTLKKYIDNTSEQSTCDHKHTLPDNPTVSTSKNKKQVITPKPYIQYPVIFTQLQNIQNSMVSNDLVIDFNALKALNYKDAVIDFLKENLPVDFNTLKSKILSDKYKLEFKFACELYIRQYGGKIINTCYGQDYSGDSILINQEHIRDIDVTIFTTLLLGDIKKNLKPKSNINQSIIDKFGMKISRFTKVISHLKAIKDKILHG